MPAKESNTTRRGSNAALATAAATTEADQKITIVEHENTGDFRAVHSIPQAVKEEEIKSWEQLKNECETWDDIRATVRRLPLNNVLPLLKELLALFDVQKARDAMLTEWIKIVLLTHTAYFMALPDVVQQLSTLYKDLDDRLTVYPKLLAMHGRLDLIKTQIDARNRKPDESEDEFDDEMEAYQSESDDDDVEDGDEDDEDDIEDDLMDMDNEEVAMFKEEEDDLNTEDEDDNLSDSEIEE